MREDLGLFKDLLNNWEPKASLPHLRTLMAGSLRHFGPCGLLLSSRLIRTGERIEAVSRYREWLRDGKDDPRSDLATVEFQIFPVLLEMAGREGARIEGLVDWIDATDPLQAHSLQRRWLRAGLGMLRGQEPDARPPEKRIPEFLCEHAVLGFELDLALWSGRGASCLTERSFKAEDLDCCPYSQRWPVTTWLKLLSEHSSGARMPDPLWERFVGMLDRRRKYDKDPGYAVEPARFSAAMAQRAIQEERELPQEFLEELQDPPRHQDLTLRLEVAAALHRLQTREGRLDEALEAEVIARDAAARLDAWHRTQVHAIRGESFLSHGRSRAGEFVEVPAIRWPDLSQGEPPGQGLEGGES